MKFTDKVPEEPGWYWTVLPPSDEDPGGAHSLDMSYLILYGGERVTVTMSGYLREAVPAGRYLWGDPIEFPEVELEPEVERKGLAGIGRRLSADRVAPYWERKQGEPGELEK